MQDSMRLAVMMAPPNAPDKADVRAHPSMVARAIEANEDAICNAGPCRVASATVEARLERAPGERLTGYAGASRAVNRPSWHYVVQPQMIYLTSRARVCCCRLRT